MTGKIRVLLFGFFLISIQIVIAQNDALLFSRMDSLNGTPIGKITGICQDSSGIMWFCSQGVQGRGPSFYRYDGNSLTNFKQDNNNPNSLGFSALETIYADKQGMIWIGGMSLDRYNPATGIFTHFKDLSNVSCILKDHKGNVWVGSFNGLDLLNEKTGKVIHFQNDSSNPKSLSDNWVNTLYEDKEGVVWVGTGMPWNPKSNKGGLNRINPDGSFTRFMHDPQNANSLVNNCLLYTSDAADEEDSVDLGG